MNQASRSILQDPPAPTSRTSAWMKFQPNGHPYPNVVIHMVVNHESPQELLTTWNVISAIVHPSMFGLG